MGFSIEDEMAEFFEGDSPDYSLELDDLHRGELVFLANGVVLSAILSKQMGEKRVAERKMALAEKVMGEIPDEVHERMDELSLLVANDGGLGP